MEVFSVLKRVKFPLFKKGNFYYFKESYNQVYKSMIFYHFNAHYVTGSFP